MKKTARLVFDLNNLPTDVALLHTIIASMASSNERLIHQLREANRRHFGRKAESVSELQMALFEKQIQAQLAAMPKLEVSPVVPKEPSVGHGRGIPAASIPRHAAWSWKIPSSCPSVFTPSSMAAPLSAPVAQSTSVGSGKATANFKAFELIVLIRSDYSRKNEVSQSKRAKQRPIPSI